MKKLFSKFLLAVLATGTLAVGVQSAAEAQRWWNGYYDYGYYDYGYYPIYNGYSYNPYNYYNSGWGYYNSPYSWNSGYWNSGNSVNLGARFLLHGLLDEIF